MARHERAAALRAAARLSAGGGENSVAGSAAARTAARARAAQASLAARRRARALERAQEVEDSPEALRDKCRRLARALRNAKHLVVYTGAGISTAADIPDYRGPRGVWTRLQRGESVERVEVSRARPTLTHMALTALWARGTLKFVVSQNCDGLHVRAGLPRRALAELHGDMFAERCATCRRVYLRAFDTTERTARHAHATPRLCHACGAQLADTIVHFGERGRASWPLNWAGALRHAAAADVVLCLGSSLKVLRRYPRLWRMQSAPHARPALYIVNLQWTPKDAVAELKINARCDDVMAQVARRLRLRVPRYSPRRDPLLAHAEPLATPEAHTTRRPLLSPLPPSSASDASDASDSSPPSSPSASDSDDEVPLRRLAERLRPPPPPLTAFQVPLRSGEATILLRAQHAPRAPSDLRRYRIARPPHLAHLAHLAHLSHPPRLNGHGPPPPQDSPPPPTSTPTPLAKLEPHDGKDSDDKNDFESLLGTVRLPDTTGAAYVKFEDKLKIEEEFPERKSNIEVDPKTESESSCSSGSSASSAARRAEAEGVAAAIIARAVAVCRAVYPGLHTILAPAAGVRVRARAVRGPRVARNHSYAECAWCARTHGARRCLWYGPPRLTPPERRAWRRVRARRYLCACCPAPADDPGAGPGAEAGAGAGAGAANGGGGGGGWYGKGYRKGRRRR